MNTPVFLGPVNRQLFGIYHPPDGNPGPSVRSVVICPPFGQEYVRSHWTLRLLASQLSRAGIHVMRIDYRGIGDSMGEPADVKSLREWSDDIVTAKNWLLQHTGASSCMLVGLRMGVNLAITAADDLFDVSSLVLWEPIQSGADWLTKRRSMHAEMLDTWVCKIKSVDNSVAQEILGTLYSRQLLNEIEQEQIDWGRIELPHLVVDFEKHQDRYPHENVMRKNWFTQDQESWEDMQHLEVAWLRPQTVRMIADQIGEMFVRLTRHGAFSQGPAILTSEALPT